MDRQHGQIEWIERFAAFVNPTGWIGVGGIFVFVVVCGEQAPGR
jgi:hypothetical protein